MMVRSLRVAHIADTHLGYRSNTIPGRQEDFSHSWTTACRAIVDSKPDLILHAGDVFHRPNPSWGALSDFLDGAAILEEAGVPTLVISGNHDSSRITTKNTVFSILSDVLPFLTISYDDTPQVHQIDELKTEVVLLSHQALLSLSLRRNLNEVLEKIGSGDYTVLVAHGDIANLEKSTEAGSTVIPDFVFDYPWSYVALGHLHIAQPFGMRGWYSGSIERCGWSDYPAQPGWTLATLSAEGLKHEQRALPHMTMIQLPNLECGGDEADISMFILEMLSRTVVPNEQAVARIQVDGIHPFSRRSIQSRVQRSVKEVYPKLLFQVTVESSLWNRDDPLDAPQGKEGQSIEEMFRDFVETRIFEDPTMSGKLLTTGLDAISKVRAVETDRDSL